MKKLVYLDNAATTKPDPRVLDAVNAFCSENYANPSGSYSFSSEARGALNRARKSVAALINAAPQELIFTSAGTEADNWALRAAVKLFVRKNVEKGIHISAPHIITTAVEHHAVLSTCRELEREGVRVTYLKPDTYGNVSPEAVEKAITAETALISIMFANNETGTLYDVAEIGRIAHSHGIPFHTDAVAAFGHVPINVKALNIDMLSASAHKLHSLKGTGLLYVTGEMLSSGFEPFIYGGAQESGRRAGTENVPGIIAFGKACELAAEEIEHRNELAALRDYFAERVLKEIKDTILNGPLINVTDNKDKVLCEQENRLPGNLNISFAGVQASSLLIELDMKGICCSTGSSCDAGSGSPSHVLRSIGLSEEEAASSLRFTLSRLTTKEEIDYTVSTLSTCVDKLRKLTGFRL